MAAKVAPWFFVLSILLISAPHAWAQAPQGAADVSAAASAASSAKSAATAAASAADAASAAVTAAASAAKSASVASSTKYAAETQDNLPIVRIHCARVMERPGIFERFNSHPTSSDTAPRLQLTADDCNIPENSPPTANQLIGAGDIEIFLEPSSYKEAAKRQANPSPRLHLYLNGVDIGADAELISAEDTAEQTRLHYHVKAGQNSQTLWASLFRTVGLVKPETLRVGLGWNAAGQTSTAPSNSAGPNVSVTDVFSLICALFVVAVLLWIWVIRGSSADVFRDAPLPAWWADALKDREELKSSLRIQSGAKGIPVGMQQTWRAATRDFLLHNTVYQGFNSSNESTYLQLAQEALERKVITSEPDQIRTYFGLVLSTAEWKPVRATFSLSRVQLGLWFIFAICAGIFLWIVYGDLPAIDGSLLGVLGISTVTTVGSLAVDQNAGGRPYLPTQGLFTDLVTGFDDDKQQIHRLQAVVVNILLLAVGVVHVAQNLTYPTFDNTWLGFLGISGVALVAGKQYLES